MRLLGFQIETLGTALPAEGFRFHAVVDLAFQP